MESFCEGPLESSNPIKEQGFNEGKTKYSSKYIRFNWKGDILYATTMVVWMDNVCLRPLGKNKNKNNTKIKNIEVLGSIEKLSW